MLVFFYINFKADYGHFKFLYKPKRRIQHVLVNKIISLPEGNIALKDI